MQRFYKGDLVVWNQINDQYKIPLAAIASYITNDTILAHDIVQDAFIGLWKHCENIKEEVDIRRYLYASVRNRSLNYRDKNKHRRAYEKEQLHLHQDQETRVVHLDAVVHIITHIMPLLKQLAPLTRNILLIDLLEDVTDAEIAQRLNTTTNTVQSKRSEGRRQLRELIYKNKGTLDLNLFLLCLFLFADLANGN